MTIIEIIKRMMGMPPGKNSEYYCSADEIDDRSIEGFGLSELVFRLFTGCLIPGDADDGNGLLRGVFDNDPFIVEPSPTLQRAVEAIFHLSLG